MVLTIILKVCLEEKKSKKVLLRGLQYSGKKQQQHETVSNVAQGIGRRAKSDRKGIAPVRLFISKLHVWRSKEMKKTKQASGYL